MATTLSSLSGIVASVVGDGIGDRTLGRVEFFVEILPARLGQSIEPPVDLFDESGFDEQLRSATGMIRRRIAASLVLDRGGREIAAIAEQLEDAVIRLSHPVRPFAHYSVPGSVGHMATARRRLNGNTDSYVPATASENSNAVLLNREAGTRTMYHRQ